MVWQCLIISAKSPANLFPIHSSQMFQRVEKARPAALKMRVWVLLDLRLCCYFISTIQTSFNDVAIRFKDVSFKTEMK